MTLPRRLASPSNHVRLRLDRVVAAFALATVGSGALGAQTDYYNTSVGRPLRVEDAIPVEYRAVELDVAPLRLELFRGSTRSWSIHPETTIGILPRMQLQIALPVAYVDAPLTSTRGLAGVEISALHALNAETSIPAVAIAADLSLPAGPLGGNGTYGSIKGILTRTLRFARFHANVQMTAGPGQPTIGDPPAPDAPDARDASRWLAGLAVDKTFPLHSILVTAESFAERPIRDGEPVAWSAGTGFRYQLSPRWAMDAGVGRRFTGDDRAWFATFGSAYVFGLR